MKRKTLSLLFALLLAVYFMPWSMAESKGTFYMKNEELGFLLTLNNLSEEDIEKERIKELGFENGDRLLYLVAMQKIIDGQKRNPGAVYENPNTDGDPIPAMNPPYSNMYVPLPSIEYLYSGSYQQP